jgi:hypothetical protein
MNQFRQPSKQQVRLYMEQRIASRTPPPSMKEIRRNLGWELIEMARRSVARK